MDPNAWLISDLADHLCSGMNMQMGVNFFVGQYPEAGMSGVPIQDTLYLVEMPGPAPDPYLDTQTHLFDLWASSSDTRSASVLMMKAYNLIHRAANFDLAGGNWHVFFSAVSTSIHDENRGGEGNKLLSLGFTVICRNLNNLS